MKKNKARFDLDSLLDTMKQPEAAYFRGPAVTWKGWGFLRLAQVIAWLRERALQVYKEVADAREAAWHPIPGSVQAGWA